MTTPILQWLLARRHAPSQVQARRLARRYRLRWGGLEDRTLPSASSGAVLAGVAVPVRPGVPRSGTLAAGEVVYFRVDPTADGRLVARVHTDGGTTRLSLLGAQGQVLLQSDGRSATDPDDLIDAH